MRNSDILMIISHLPISFQWLIANGILGVHGLPVLRHAEEDSEKKEGLHVFLPEMEGNLVLEMKSNLKIATLTHAQIQV